VFFEVTLRTQLTIKKKKKKKILSYAPTECLKVTLSKHQDIASVYDQL